MNRAVGQLSIFALLLGASVAGKLMLLRADVSIDQSRTAGDVATLLARRGVVIQISKALDAPIIAGTKDECRLAVRLSPVSGELDQLTRLDFRQFERVRFQYRGGWYKTPPRGLPYLRYESTRAANRMGWAVGWNPVFAVADNGRCEQSLFDLSTIDAQWHRDRRF